MMPLIIWNSLAWSARKNACDTYNDYWSDVLRGTENVVINTPIEPHRSCGIANVGIKQMKPADLAKTLFDEFKIFTVAIDQDNVQGCRITPNVYSTTRGIR